MTTIGKRKTPFLVRVLVATALAYAAFVFVTLEPNVMAWPTADRLFFLWVVVCAVAMNEVLRRG